MSIAIEWRT